MKFTLAVALAAVGANASFLSKAGDKSASLLATKSSMKAAAAARAKKAMTKYMESVRSEVASAAEARGQSYSEYDGDDDEVVYGEGGVEHELIDENPRIGVHQFIEDEDDAPEPEAYEGEDTEQIDADDDETNFGADAPEDSGAEESEESF
jgi:hypothetical protein